MVPAEPPDLALAGLPAAPPAPALSPPELPFGTDEYSPSMPRMLVQPLTRTTESAAMP